MLIPLTGMSGFQDMDLGVIFLQEEGIVKIYHI